MLTMYQQITINTLVKQGQKKTLIARELGCHRNTVRNVILRKSVKEKQTRKKSSYFTFHHDQIKEWVEKDVSNLRMYEILKETCQISRSYDSLCKYIQREFPKTPEAFGVQVTRPGEEAEVDFGYVGLQPMNSPGTPLTRGKTWVLAVKLSYSRAAYHEVTADQKVSTLTAGLTRAFVSFGGAPKRLKVDNLRAAIFKNQHFDLQFNQDFLEWANHIGCVIVPCTPYHPEQKGKVEADVKYVSGNFFAERTFSDRSDLVRQLSDWTKNYANQRVHGTTKRVPAQELLLVERTCLQPLPKTPYTVFERAERTVSKNCHLFFANNYYSVPSGLVGKIVTIRFDSKLLRIISQGEEVACHVISEGMGNYLTQRSHLPEHKCYGVTEYQKKYEEKMAEIGEFAHHYFMEVLLKHDTYWFRSIRPILGLADKHGAEVVNLALKRALHFKVLGIDPITTIVEKKLYLLPLPPRLLSTLVETGTASEGSLSLPLTNPELNRDLSYYQQLLEGSNS